MQTFEIESGLWPLPARGTPKPVLVDALCEQRRSGRDRTVTQRLVPHSAILPGDLYHQGYLRYLDDCYASHQGVTVAPDHVWQTLLGELAGIVRADAEGYRRLFTTRAEKQTITCDGLPEPGGVEPWVRAVLDRLYALCPTDVDRFLPRFSTTTLLAETAHGAAFMDLVSPYYDYAMKVCGFPTVTVEGTPDDWWRLLRAWAGLAPLFPAEAPYFQRVSGVLTAVVNRLTDPSLWGGMYHTQLRCGSGGGEELDGWFVRLYRTRPQRPFVQEFPTGLAQVDFKFLPENQDYRAVFGVLSSSPGEFGRVPEWGFVVLKRLAEPLVTPYGEPARMSVLSAR